MQGIEIMIVNSELHMRWNEGMACINLNECHENWKDYKEKKEKFPLLQNGPRYVGQRDITGKPAYFCFFTRPFTKIEFNMDNAEEATAYRLIRDKLQESGWYTYDLS